MFFMFSIATALWGSVTFLSYQFSDPDLSLWLIRFTMFCAVFQSFFLYTLFRVFPEETFAFSKLEKLVLFPVVCLTALLTLTPAVFSNISGSAKAGEVALAVPGPGLIVFAAVAIPLVILGVVFLARKTRAAMGNLRTGYNIMFIGIAITFALVITFNFIFAAILEKPYFVPYGAAFMFPLVASLAYTILRNGLFNIKVAATALLVLVLSVMSLSEIAFSENASLLLFRVSIFILILATGILLIRNVIKEVKQRELIERLSEEKSEFMTFASHEIRNPITAMRGLASLIVDGTTGVVSADTKDVAQKILIAGHDVLNIISTYLSKSKMELGQISYDKAVFDLGEAAANMAEGYAPHAEIKGLKLEIDIDRTHKYNLVGDQGKVKEVLGNLVDNALKYTKEGTIRVAVERHGPFVRAVISDSGVGIPEETLKELFKKFSRADAQKVNLLGTGIGLFLAKTFIEAQGGRIWAESNGQGKGSRFIIEFPAA